MALYDIPIHTLQGDDAELGDYAGKTLLLVNVASKCGLTPQYEGLERLQKTYADRGFSVIGFPCNQFLEQEPGTAEEIEQFCSTTYGVTFPLMEKIEVNGEGRHPIYAELTEKADAEGKAGDITWNFEKFLVSPKGDVRGALPAAGRARGPGHRERHRGAARRLTPPRPAPAGFSASIFDMDGLLHRLRGALARGRDRDPRRARRAAVRRRHAAPRRGCSSTRSRGTGSGSYPWADPTPDELAVTIVDRVIELILSKGGSSPGPSTPSTSARAGGCRLAVASSSEYRLIDAALLHFGLRDRFAVIHSAEDEQYGKPHPAVFLTAAAKLGAPPQRCLVWEDAPAGVLAAKAASMACIAVPERARVSTPPSGWPTSWSTRCSRWTTPRSTTVAAAPRRRPRGRAT